MKIHKGSIVEEVQQHLDARWIYGPKDLWKIFIFTIYRMNPCVERLQIHLPNRHQVRFYKYQNINYMLNDDTTPKPCSHFFTLNVRDPQSRKFLYREILEHYC